MDGKLRNMTSVYLVAGDSLLCLYRIGSRVANNRYVGAAGGHFEQSELNDARRCVLREMKEELNLTEDDVENLRLRYITLRFVNGEIRQNYYFFAGMKTQLELESTEGRLRWVPFADLSGLDMPISAKHMILHYAHIGRFDEKLYCGVTGQEGTDFVPLEQFEG